MKKNCKNAENKDREINAGLAKTVQTLHFEYAPSAVNCRGRPIYQDALSNRFSTDFHKKSASKDFSFDPHLKAKVSSNIGLVKLRGILNPADEARQTILGITILW